MPPIVGWPWCARRGRAAYVQDDKEPGGHDRGSAGQPTSASTGSTLGYGFGVLGVAIRREPWVFTLSTLGSLLFGALTVADAWVLGWSTDNVMLPAFEPASVATGGADHDPRALRRRRHRSRRSASWRAGCGAGIMQYRMQAHVPPRGHPAVPPAAAVLAPAPPHRPAAVQRQLRRRGRLGADRAAADGGRHRRDDGRSRSAQMLADRPGAGRWSGCWSSRS